MATYIGIKGIEIQTIAGDPANPIIGQVWYNTTANTLKGYGAQGTGAWATGGALNTARSSIMPAGTQTAAIGAGGDYGIPAASPTWAVETETYDGSTWTEVGDLNTARHAGAGGGSTTSFIYAAGTPGGTNSESYDGTSWTATSAINTSREDLGGAATSNTSALVFGGYAGSLPGTGATESWDGSSWTEVADLATGTYHVDGTGTSILALRIGGFNPGAATSTEEWSIPDATKTFTSS